MLVVCRMVRTSGAVGYLVISRLSRGFETVPDSQKLVVTITALAACFSFGIQLQFCLNFVSLYVKESNHGFAL
jgi:hypothetical protein